MSPQNWLCRSERNPALDMLALNSPLVHLNGDNAYSPQIPDTQNYTVTSKVQFLQLQPCLSSKSNEHNPSHVRRHTLPSQPSQLLITQFHLNKHNFSTSLAAPKANPIFHAANKTLFTKTHFDLRHLTSSSSSHYFSQISEGLATLSKETTQRKHTYVTTLFLANNKLSFATNKPTSPAKIILQNHWLKSRQEL